MLADTDMIDNHLSTNSMIFTHGSDFNLYLLSHISLLLAKCGKTVRERTKIEKKKTENNEGTRV